MNNSIYIALSRQLTQFRDLEVTADNLANVNTTGYQEKKVLFSDYLTDAGNRQKVSFVNDAATYRSTKNGNLKVTGNALDVAIQGPGYFAVQTAEGATHYTRNGGFSLNQNGELISSEGEAVLDDGGQPIVFQPEDKDVSVRQNGALVVDGQERTRLGVFQFENAQNLVPNGDNTLSAENGERPQAADETKISIKHGVLESSNVDPVLAITKLTELQRSVSDTSQFIETMYDLQRKAGRTWLSQNA